MSRLRILLLIALVGCTGNPVASSAPPSAAGTAADPGRRCRVDSDCVPGLVCHGGTCTAPIGRECQGPGDASCPAGFECVRGCGPPVVRPGDPPPPYVCQLKGYVADCPICLAANTLIDTPSGPIPITQMRVGAPVWTTDTSGRRVPAIVGRTGTGRAPATHLMVRLVLEDGRELLASPGHPAVGGGTVGDLQPGDTYAGASVVSTDRVPYGDGATYDILPSGDTGRYWANGILVGSSLRETVPTAVVDVVLRAPPTLRRPTGPDGPVGADESGQTLPRPARRARASGALAARRGTNELLAAEADAGDTRGPGECVADELVGGPGAPVRDAACRRLRIQ